MELKPGYKQTEVGVIPEDWKIKAIGEICLYQNGIALEKFFNNHGGYSVISIGNYSLYGKFVETGCFISRENTKELRKFLLKKNELTMLLNDKTAAGTIIGRVLFIDSDDKYIFNQRTMRLTTKGEVDSKYLYFQINNPSTHQRVVDLAKPGTQIYVNTGDITNLKIPFPTTKAEQTAIANVLGDADVLIQSLTRLIAKKRQIKQGAMQTLLNPYENGRLKDGWGFVTYGDAFNFLVTASFSRNELSSSGEYGYIHYGDIHTLWDGFVDFKKDFVPAISQTKAKNYVVVNDGDLIMADASEDYDGIGKSVEIKGIGNRKVISGLHTFLLRDKRGVFVNGYKGYIQSSRFVKKQLDKLATGLKVYGVSKTNLKVIEIPLPPKNEQTRIATILSDMDTEITALEAKLARYQHIKQGMMQNLLTGRIRLVKPESNTGAAA